MNTVYALNRLKHKLFNKRRRIVFFALFGILCLMGISHILYKWLATYQTAGAIEPLLVQTVKVKEASMPQVLETVGVLTAERELKIKTPLSGKIQKIWVESGSFVKEGTQLVSIIGAADIKAPFDGTLTDWQVKPGELVNAGAELVDIVNTSVLSLVYRAPEAYAAKLKVNQPVVLTIHAFPDKQFKGRVQFVSPKVDRRTHTIALRATIENRDQVLLPGMSARLQHVLETRDHALVIPESALMITLEGHEVYVVQEGKLIKQKVFIGGRKKGRVEINSGLNAGESVVMTRTDVIKEGELAKAVDWLGEW